MTEKQITKIVKSTYHIVMSEPMTLMPVGIGSGCIITYGGKEILLTVAHVTNMEATTCIVTGQPPVNFHTPLYSVGSMNYLSKFDTSRYSEQLIKWADKSIKKEEKDFGLIDFSFATLKHKIVFIQKQTDFNVFTVPSGKKLKIKSKLTEKPFAGIEYGFFGRIKPIYFKGTPNADIFETQEVVYGGLKFIQKIGHYYEFELPSPVTDHADFKGTSGAPIMDTEGNLVSLVTHGYDGSRHIYGVALADFKSGLDGMLQSEDDARNC